MQQGGSRRAGAAVWRERVARQGRSELSVQEFCRREGVSAWSFYRWRLRVRAADGAGERAAKRSAVVRAQPVPAQAAFIDLGALSGSPGPGWEIRLDLGGGVVLQLARR
jgi:hypothetical protein